ncbi:MAG: T9SS type A sorting domain-containing protein [Edaphocola sp.]
MKKIIYALCSGLLAGALGTIANAQTFTFTANPVDSTTTGTEVKTADMTDYPYVEVVTYIQNTSSSAFSANWKLVSDTTDYPSGWKLTGICDNVSCYAVDSSWFINRPTKTTMDIAVDGTSLLDVRVYAPYTAANGTGVFKIMVSTLEAVDTAVFILNKATTGISTINVTDKRVNLYPNPTSNNLIVYADKNLGAARLDVISLTGARVTTALVAKEVTTINTSEMAKGIYTVKVVDEKGNLITTRKFTKD